MHEIFDISMEKNILEANLRIAEDNEKKLKKYGIRAFDVLGSIGSGKTALIECIAEELKKKGVNVGAIAGDVAGDDDYQRFLKCGIQAVNVNTGKECHLDAHYIEHALEKLNLDQMDVLFIENIGNLVCPADFPLGTEKRVIVISVTEGDDMVRKHPIIFAQADIVVLNKTDLAEYVDVDPNIIVSDFSRVNPNAAIILTDVKHKKGIDELMRVLNL
jgi:hydrogenase nickel incorporation protein HypB